MLVGWGDMNDCERAWLALATCKPRVKMKRCASVWASECLISFCVVAMAELDQDLNSRQIWTYGLEAMQKMASSSVAVLGMNGVGAEVAKNLILANVKDVALFDDRPTSFADLSSHFYLSESDIGSNRAHACRVRLQELNPAVSVTAHAIDYSSASACLSLQQHGTVVLCDVPLDECVKLNEFCRAQRPVINFVMVQACGLCFRVFSDFGSGADPASAFKFVSIDSPYIVDISNIETVGPHTATIHLSIETSQSPAPSDGNTVEFIGIQGASQLNGLKLKAKNCSRYKVPPNSDTAKCFCKFDVDTLDLVIGGYLGQGQITQVIVPETAAFDSLSHSLDNPGKDSMMFFFNQQSQFSRQPPIQLHIAFAAFNSIYKSHASPADPDAFLSTSRAIFAAMPPSVKEMVGDLDEDVMRSFARTCIGCVNPICATAGGIAAQQAIKSCTQKFLPMSDPQWLYFDALDAAPAADASGFDLQNGRYDGQIALFGRGMQDVLGEMKVFLVGAGALGCELLKNFALMGVGCGKNGKVVITDNDHIEKSNLSRQFLFRSHHIGKSKSAVAAESAQSINASLRVTSVDLQARKQTEGFFSDAFWSDIDIATNALDNFAARKYVMSRCLRFAKPLLESATQGLMFDTSVYLPHISNPYVGGSDDDPSAGIPVCTIKEFPSNAAHCLSFAKSEFIMEFTKVPAFTKSVLLRNEKPNDPDDLLILERISESMVTMSSFEQCVAWAIGLYHEYVFRIRTLTLEHPQDEVTDTGMFWTAPKRFPVTSEFNESDPMLRSFVFAAAVLKAKTCGIVVPDRSIFRSFPLKGATGEGHHDSLNYVEERSHKLAMKPFVLDQLPADADEEHIQALKAESEGKIREQNCKHMALREAAISRILAQLSHSSNAAASQFQSFDFNKDDADHMDFVFCLASLRMRAYGIVPELDRLNALRIIGNSIPAVATSTAIAAGLVCIDLYRIALKLDVCTGRTPAPLPPNELKALCSHFKANHCSTGYNSYLMEDQQPLQSVDSNYKRLGSVKWSPWECWCVEGCPTVADVISFLKAKGVDVLQIEGLSFEGGNSSAYELSLSMPDRPIAPLLSSLPDYADKMSGKNYIELRVTLSDSVRVSVGVADSQAHVKLPSAEPAWTLLQIKRNLRDSHGIDWAFEEETAFRFSDSAAQHDRNSTIVPNGATLTLVPPPKYWVSNFPVLLIHPHTPLATSMKKSRTCLTVVVCSTGEADREVEVVPNGCTVAELKAMLQKDHDVPWAVASSKCLNEMSKPLKDDALVPATGRFKLKKM